ncbi:MAG: hypothetical protein QXH42_02495 [Thermoplasmata archaeon]
MGERRALARLRRVNWARTLYLALMLLGILLYIIWGSLHNAFLDIGLYSVVILMVGIGAAGYYLYTIAPDGGKK